MHKREFFQKPIDWMMYFRLEIAFLETINHKVSWNTKPKFSLAIFTQGIRPFRECPFLKIVSLKAFGTWITPFGNVNFEVEVDQSFYVRTITDIWGKLYAGVVQQVLFVSPVTCNQEIFVDTQRMEHSKAIGHRFVEKTLDESGSLSSSKIGGRAVDIMSQSQSKLAKWWKMNMKTSGLTSGF